MKKYDVVIAGAGVGGLTCAALLTKRGLRVAIFEKEENPGGYCTSFSQNGYLFDSCIDSIGNLSKGSILRDELDSLKIFDKIKLIELNPIRRNIFPDLTIDIPNSYQQYQSNLQDIFPKYSDGIYKAFSIMNDIYRWSNDSVLSESVGFDLQFWVNRTFKSLLDDHFDDARLQAIFSSYCNFLGLPASEVSAVAASNILMHYLNGGAFRIEGGIQNLITALISEIEINNGEIYLGESVEEILCTDGAVRGVKTNIGREILASNIVSNMDIKTVINSMLKPVYLTHGVVERINKLESSGSFIIVYLGLDYDLTEANLVSSIGYFSSYELNAMLNQDGNISFGISIPSLSDESLVPKGGSNIVIHWPFCYNDNNKPDKEIVTDRLIVQLDKLIPGVKKHIIYKSIADSDTLYRYTGNYNGAAYGWAQNAELFANLPFLRNIMENLYIVGHWAGYGGGVMPSMLSAIKVSRMIGR